MNAMSPHATPFVFAPFGFVLLVLLVGIIGYVGFKLTRSERSDADDGADQALETLRRRFANGEIDEEEFQMRKERLIR